ncbi:MAG: hypothetical protein KTR30_30805 [Saprospiraceae bacterium]|nr:hypothetical protein [Saprospiraceae bacterium]
MFKFFRQIRKRLLDGGKVNRYLVYAGGEILLVMIGILLALQINNANEARKDRNKEIGYLTNIREDLITNGEKIDALIERRNKRIETAHKLIGHLEGDPVEDWHQFNLEIIQINTWERFYQHNYTFQELISSGNLSYIKNDSIKTLLFELESTYKRLKAEEDHWRFDSEELVFKPAYEDLDMQLILRDYRGEPNVLSNTVFKDFFADRKVKNGYVMATVEFGTMNRYLQTMKRHIEEISDLIDEEISKG